MRGLPVKGVRRLPPAFLRSSLVSAALCAVIPCYSFAQARTNRPNAELHKSTDWRVSASLKFDALCFLNIMSGDPFYVSHYKEDYDRFEPQLTPPVRAALANIRRKIKDKNGGIVPAFLCLYFSATDDETLGEMLATLDDSAIMERNLRQTPYFSGGGWRLFLSIRPDLKVALSFLETCRFEEYWRRTVYPRAQRKLAEIEAALPKYNVVPAIERALGSALPSDRVTIYLLYYSHPHGMRLTGPRFVANTAWPFAVVVQNAIHEMLHPPYDLARDSELQKALASLKRDRFLMDKIKNHNPSFGYNSLESFVEEDCVRALEQAVQERLGIGREPRRRWREEDDGVHVFAAALYGLMQQDAYENRGESFRDYLFGVIHSGRLAAGNIEPLYKAFYRDSDL